VAAVEDSAFGPWLNQDGIYRIEDASRQIARVGQGRILDRVRRHRASPVVFPHRLVAATATDGAWTVAERCYLEERLADHWLAAGHALASSTFIREHPLLPAGRRPAMDAVLKGLLELLAAGQRLDERGNPLGFRPCTSYPGVARTRASTWFKEFPTGTKLEFRDAHVFARALARHRDVVLLPDSLIHLLPASHVGKLFRQDHLRFLTEAGAVDIGSGIGRTTLAVACPTAAALMKRATAGRLHNGSKWRPLRASGAH
jgi:hypothetical protein